MGFSVLVVAEGHAVASTRQVLATESFEPRGAQESTFFLTASAAPRALTVVGELVLGYLTKDPPELRLMVLVRDAIEDHDAMLQADSSEDPAAAAPAGASAAERAALQEARERLIQLTARAVSAGRTIRNMEQQQARQGVGMRGDMAAARDSMEFLMGEAKDAIEARDFDTAKRNMDLAERALEKLEGFLGR